MPLLPITGTLLGPCVTRDAEKKKKIGEKNMGMTRHEMAGLIFAMKTYDPSKPLYVSQQVKQAYDAVDAFEKHSKEYRLEEAKVNVSMLEQLLVKMSHDKIKTIKELRAATGLGLKEAKEAVEELIAKGRLPAQIAEFLCDKEAEQRVYSIELAPEFAEFAPEKGPNKPLLLGNHLVVSMGMVGTAVPSDEEGPIDGPP